MTTSEKILQMLKDQLSRAVEDEAQAKFDFDKAEKEWQAAQDAAFRCACGLSNYKESYDELSLAEARAAGVLTACNTRYHYHQGQRTALESAFLFAEAEVELQKKLEADDKFWDEVLSEATA